MKYGKHSIRALTLAIAAVVASLPNASMAAQVEEEPGGYVMAADLLVARPLGVVLVALGTTTYVASLPFSLLGGNAGDAGRLLVIQPARETFVRCLGCRRIGRKEKIKD